MKLNNLVLEVIDVMLFEEGETGFHNEKRSYSALSYRLESDRSVFKIKNKNIPVNTDDICLVPQNIKYERSARKERIIVFHFNVYNHIDDEIKVFNVADSEKYRSSFMRALDLWQEKAVGYRYRVTAILYNIMSDLQLDGNNIFSEVDSDVSSALDMIESGFTDPDFKVESLAERLYISQAYLRRKFNNQLGVSPKKYLTKRRIQEAEIMLKSRYYSQKEISRRCGFTDVKYFRTVFKEETGRTITQYKTTI